MDRILLCDSKKHAYEVSEEIYDLECSRKNCTAPKTDRTTKYKFGVYENIISSQFGLRVDTSDWDTLPDEFRRGEQVYTPLWIDEKFINGMPFMAAGVGPFGVARVDPDRNRRILEGNYSPEFIRDVRDSARKFSLAVHDRARQVIEDILHDTSNQEKLVESIDPFIFEEVVAELLRANGFDVFLTPRTGDGGKDVLAAFPHKGEHLLMMVECKRRKAGSVLGPVDVRALLGQFYFERDVRQSGIGCAMLVTTAKTIGPTALEFHERVSHLSIKAFDNVIDWMKDYGQMRTGLWTPRAFDDFL